MGNEPYLQKIFTKLFKPLIYNNISPFYKCAFRHLSSSGNKNIAIRILFKKLIVYKRTDIRNLF